MLIDEILHTCSNEKVAQAAVASLGSDFSSRVKSAADFYHLSVGAFTARVVHDFGEDARAHERRVVDCAMHKADQPILRGLQVILERELQPMSPFRGRGMRAAAECGFSANP